MTDSAITEQTILAGLDAGEFVYYYQPKVSLITGKVIGAEALIRWQRPDGQTVLPKDFIPLAEQTGLIKQISYRMFAKLARDLLIFSDIDSRLVTSVNASAQDFADGRFCTMVLETLEQLCIPTKNLQIEITETTVLNADPDVRKNIQTLCDAASVWRWTITAPVIRRWKP
ncbi:EAL domain-containing protein [Methylomonas koyamae]|uniref:EAL domain-containing protein n=1 Tax=Methylomonas koyamae TaxID=702114 RepID=UPI0006D222E4|nr:EAL domain-containing protein [Methylomonas koyamae]